MASKIASSWRACAAASNSACRSAEQLVCRTVEPDASARRIMDRERIGKSLDDRVKSPAQPFGGAAGLLHLAGQETDRKPDGQVHEQVQSILDARNHEREHWWQEQ